MEAVKGSQPDRCGYPLSAPLQLHHRRRGQHSPVHSSAVVGDPWRPDSHLPTPPPPPLPILEGPVRWCALWPPGLMGQQRRTRNLPGQVPEQGSAQRAQGPLHMPPAPQAVGVWDPATMAAPPVPTGSQGARVPPSCARRTPVPVRTQSWDGRAACLCDQEDAMRWPTTPRWAQRQAPMASPTGPGAPGHTCPPCARPSPSAQPTNAGGHRNAWACGPGAACPCDPSCAMGGQGTVPLAPCTLQPRPHPCPRARLHTGRRYLPPTCASVGSSGCRQSARRWNRTVR